MILVSSLFMWGTGIRMKKIHCSAASFQADEDIPAAVKEQVDEGASIFLVNENGKVLTNLGREPALPHLKRWKKLDTVSELSRFLQAVKQGGGIWLCRGGGGEWG